MRHIFNFFSAVPAAVYDFAIGNDRLRKRSLPPVDKVEIENVAAAAGFIGAVSLVPIAGIVAAGFGADIGLVLTVVFGTAAACTVLPSALYGQTVSLRRAIQHDRAIPSTAG